MPQIIVTAKPTELQGEEAVMLRERVTVAEMYANRRLAAEIRLEEAHHPGRVIDQVQLALRNAWHDEARKATCAGSNLTHHRIRAQVVKSRRFEQLLGGVPAQLSLLVVVDVHP